MDKQKIKQRLLARLRRKRGAASIDGLLRGAMRDLWRMSSDEYHFKQQMCRLAEHLLAQGKLWSFHVTKDTTNFGQRFDFFYQTDEHGPTFCVALHSLRVCAWETGRAPTQ